jgi:ABC-type nitrate/sulfonate/bicarbonate transport system ATPase subunit
VASLIPLHAFDRQLIRAPALLRKGDRVIVLTHGPGRVRAEIEVSLPAPSDQITTKETCEFAHLRTEVSRLVRANGAEPVAQQSA